MFDAWKRFQKYSPKWWWNMVMERFHGTIRSKKKRQKKTHPGQEYFSQKKMTQTSTFHIQQWLIYQMISEMTWQKKQLTIGGKKPPKVNDNKLAFRITDGKPHAVVTFRSYRKDVSQICVHIPVLNIISGGDIIPYFIKPHGSFTLFEVKRTCPQKQNPRKRPRVSALHEGTWETTKHVFWGASSWILPMLDFLVGKIRRWVGGANFTVRVSGGCSWICLFKCYCVRSTIT